MENTPGAQYTQYTGKYGTSWYVNLCGQYSLKIVYESYYGVTYDIHDIIDLDDRLNGTGRGDLSLIAQDMFPNGWSATYYWGASTATYHSSGLITNSKPLTRNWWLGDDGKDHMGEILGQILGSGSYIIAGVWLDTGNNSLVPSGTAKSVEHWVVLAGVFENGVKIVDPFCNCVRYLTWTQFEATSTGGIIALKPPPDAEETKKKGQNTIQ